MTVKAIFFSTEKSCPPVVISLGGNKKLNEVTRKICSLLGTTEQPNSNLCKFGKILSTPNVEKRNPVACLLGVQYSLVADDYKNLVRGRAVLLGEVKNNIVESVSPEAIQTVMKLFHEMVGFIQKGDKKVKVGPTQAKRPFDIFSSQFNKEYRDNHRGEVGLFGTISKLSNAKWKTMTDEEKMPYILVAKKDAERYRREKEEWLREHQRAPKQARNAYQIYCNEVGGEQKSLWTTSMTKADQEPYQKKSTLDKLVYQQNLEKFRQHCLIKGRDFEAETARKKRTRKTDNPSADEIATGVVGATPKSSVKVVKKRKRKRTHKSKSNGNANAVTTGSEKKQKQKQK